MHDAKETCISALPDPGPAWLVLLPGISLWALALYLPLSLVVQRLEQPLASSGLSAAIQQLLLGFGSLVLALLLGALLDLLLGWALGPSWATSLGLIAVGWGLFTAFANPAREDQE